MEGIAIGISIAALFVSILAPLFEYWWNKRLNKHNLTAEYFMKVYGEILYKDLPIAHEYIHFSNDLLSGTDKMLEVLRNIRQRSIYFKTVDSEYYKKLLLLVQGLEDFIVNTSEHMTTTQFNEFYNGVDARLEEIYKHMGTKNI